MRIQVSAEVPSDVRGEARANLAGELELLALEVPDDERIDAASAVGAESADDELLLIFEL